MTHDEAQTMFSSLARDPAPRAGDVTASVMRDVRRLAPATPDDDRVIWRLAAALSALAAIAVVAAALALEPADNPLAEFAQQTTQALEAR